MLGLGLRFYWHPKYYPDKTTPTCTQPNTIAGSTLLSVVEQLALKCKVLTLGSRDFEITTSNIGKLCFVLIVDCRSMLVQPANIIYDFTIS